MKKIAILLAAIALTVCTYAQSTTPRFGITKNADNTGRALNYNYVAPTDATGNDTTKINPSAFNTYVYSSITDSTTYDLKVTGSKRMDQLIFVIKNSSGAGHKVKFITSTNVQVGSGGLTLALTTAKRATIAFIFDGSVWVELYRVVQ